MPERLPEEEQAVTEGEEYQETQPWGLDHPNVKRMDNIFLVTMNNEHIKRGNIPRTEVPLVKDEVEIMAGMERLLAGGHLDVETVRAIEAGRFTLDRSVESATDGFFLRMEHSQYNYEAALPVAKKQGFLGRIFNRGQEQPMYRADRPYQQ